MPNTYEGYSEPFQKALAILRKPAPLSEADIEAFEALEEEVPKSEFEAFAELWEALTPKIPVELL